MILGADVVTVVSGLLEKQGKVCDK